MGPQLSDLETVLRRHNRDFLCPICSGCAETPKGRGLRCAGFSLGRVAYCTREQYAGSLALDVATSPPTYRHSLSTDCDCGQRHGEQFFSPQPFPNAPTQTERLKRTSVPIEARHVVYSAALELLDLRDDARDDLISRGLSPEAINQAGYKSIPRLGAEHRDFIANMAESLSEESLMQCPGFTGEDGRLDFWAASGTRDGHVVPYRDEHGFISGLQLKVLGGKYLTARGSILSSVYHLSGTAGPGQDLYVTEGATKATVASYLGGIWTFAVAGQSLIPEHIDIIKRLRPGRVIVALDQEDNVNTDRARERWCETLLKNGLRVFIAIWEGQDLGGAKGLDDLLLNGGHPRIRRVGSALRSETDLILSMVQSEIGKYHMGPGEVRHGGGEPRLEENVAGALVKSCGNSLPG